MSRQEWEALNAIVTALVYLASTAMYGDAERVAVGKAIDAIKAIEPHPEGEDSLDTWRRRNLRDWVEGPESEGT